MKFLISETENRKDFFLISKFIHNTVISSVYYNYWQFNFTINHFIRNFTIKKLMF